MGIDRLKAAFAAGNLLRPSAERRNFVDLVRAMARLTGVEGVPSGPGVDTLYRLIDRADRYVFVLVDGMGLHLLEMLPENSFLRSFHSDTLQAVFPSTTATALTTLATAQWPCRHSIPGWWMYLEEKRISAVTVRFQGRFTGKPLEELGVGPHDLFPFPGFWSCMRGGSLSLLPEKIAHTTFSRYVSGGAPRAGYKGIENALQLAREQILAVHGPGFIFLYLPQLDALSHKKGPDHQETLDLLLIIDRALRGLSESLSGRARLIISADHGQIRVPGTNRFLLERIDPLLSLLHTHPTGEPNVPIFHVRKGREKAFQDIFTERFGRFFDLLGPEEVDDLKLLGPDDMAPLMRKRLGTFVGIALEPSILCTRPPEGNGFYNEGFHSGLTPQEMLIPLILH